MPVFGLKQQYDVAMDGRFLLNVPVETVPAQAFKVVVNWTAFGSENWRVESRVLWLSLTKRAQRCGLSFGLALFECGGQPGGFQSR